MSSLNFRKNRNHRGFFFRLSRHLPTFILLLIIALLLGGGIFAFSRFVLKQQPRSLPASATASEANRKPDKDKPSTTQEPDPIDTLIAQADRLAKGYDYDKAMELLQQDASLAADSRIVEAVSTYQSEKDALVPADVKNVTHVFFHSLIMDTAKAFDGDSRSGGYNSVMTTKDEFLKILDALYNDGYVLVRIHDIAYETSDENGNPVFTWGNIMLPEGKKPIVMSQDDVCYYEYMDGDGFASRIVVGEDGKPVCEMKMDDGSISVGAYDLVPLLDEFIEEHPDFSYRGAKAVLAFTGYNGILGYRTAASYGTAEYQAEHPDFNYEEEKAQAAKVAQALKDDGYELASHSWGHRDMGAISMEDFVTDTNKWDTEVAPLIGGTDIILFPFGSDISDWRPYKDDNERFQYLKSKGFRYFCNVDSSQYYVQIGTDHMRQGRRNLDGYRMYYDLPESNPTKTHLDDLFNVEEVFDRSRPTPVPPMG